MKKFNAVSLLILFTLIGMHPFPVQGQEGRFASLAKYVPPDCNSIMIVDLDHLRQSKIAGVDKWFESMNSKMETGLGFLPDAEIVLVAANVDLNTMFPRWSVTLLKTDSRKVYSPIRAEHETSLDELYQREFVDLDALKVIPLDDATIAYYASPNQQHFAYWLKAIEQGAPRPSNPWLETVISQAESSGAEMAYFVDMEHSITRQQVLDDVRDSTLLKENNIDPREFAKLASSAKRFSLLTQVDSDIATTVQLEFNDEIGMFKPIASPLMQEILEREGLSLPESLRWQIDISDHSIAIDGKTNAEGFGQMVSLLDAPTYEAVQYDYGNDAETYANPGQRSKSYLMALEFLVEDLRKHERAQIYFVSNAIWYERFAARIERLSEAQVDSQIIEFSDEVVKSLIEAATELRNLAQLAKSGRASLMASRTGSGSDDFLMRRSGTNGRFSYSSRNYGRGGTGRYERESNTQQFAEQAGRSLNERLDVIKKRIVDLKRYVTSEYNVDF